MKNIEPPTFQFRQGDRVQLKSGGAMMTIECVAQGLATCVWIDGNGLHNYTVGVSMLVYKPDLPDAGFNVSPENQSPVPQIVDPLADISLMSKDGHQ